MENEPRPKRPKRSELPMEEQLRLRERDLMRQQRYRQQLHPEEADQIKREHAKMERQRHQLLQPEEANRVRQKHAQRERKRCQQLQPEEANRVRQEHAQRQRERRQRLQPEEAERIRQKNVQRQRERRQQMQPEEADLARQEHAQKERQRRQQLEAAEANQSRLEDVQRKREQRQRQQANTHNSARSYMEAEITGHYGGPMNVICEFCQAKHFKGERLTSCCEGGRVVLPLLQEYPAEFAELLFGTDKRVKNFQENIRQYNSAFAFASFAAKIDQPPSHGPKCYRIHGQIYHNIYALHPNSDQHPKYGQLYILDSEAAAEERMGNEYNSNCQKETMKKIDGVLREINPYAKAYKYMYEVEKEEMELAQAENRPPGTIKMVFDTADVDTRRYNAPRANEVAAVFVGEEGNVPEHISVAVYPRTQYPRTLQYTSPHCDPMTYPLLFPKGDQGWNNSLKHQPKPGASTTNTTRRDKTTLLEFYSYRLSIRDSTQQSPIHCGRLLFQQYVVDAFVKVEQDRLQYIRTQLQPQLRMEYYQGLLDHISHEAERKDARVGKVVLLPPSFRGSPRSMLKNYQDAMAIVRKYGKPDLFLTFTCNPKWREITENLQPTQTAADRPDLVARVFKMKLQQLKKELFDEQRLGKVVAHLHVIEFQKRGLPHAHMLIFLAEDDKLRTPEDVDKVVWAEIPDAEETPELHKLVLSHMVHGPCGMDNPNSPCMDNFICTRGYPKSFKDTTNMNINGYPEYRRRDNGVKAKVGRHEVGNQWIVPYNPYLLKQFDAHINVEICATIKAIKYLFKYIYKGHDRARLKLIEKEQTKAANGTLNWDEISIFLDTRYVSPPEAIWRLRKEDMHQKSHTIVRLAVHLPNMQQVYFMEGDERQAQQAAATKATTLTSWFQLNNSDPAAHQYLYHEIPEHYLFENNKWRPRKRGGEAVIGRMATVPPKDKERFHLRLLLLHVRGAKSFDDIQMVNGVKYTTFYEAAKARGLLEDDAEWDYCLQEAAVFQMPAQLRLLFAVILTQCDQLKNPVALWEKYKEDLCEDFSHHMPSEDAIYLGYHHINQIMVSYNAKQSWEQFGLPLPPMPPTFIPENSSSNNPEAHKAIGQAMYNSLNPAQRDAADRILSATAMDDAASKLFYTDGPGGSGKTFLYKALIHVLKGEETPVLAVASTGIAATLLPDGKTAHSTFQLPVPTLSGSTCQIRPQSADGQLMKNTKVIIWDEAPMLDKDVYHAVDMMLRDVKCIDVPFGGTTVVLGGDFRQILPIRKFATTSETIQHSLKCYDLWPEFAQLQLTQNMRALPDQQDFMSWLLKVGEGDPTITANEEIPVPPQCIVPDVVDSIFGHQLRIDDPTLLNKAILTPYNEEALKINERILDLLPGPSKIYHSIDSACCDDQEEAANYPTEFLNSLTPSGMPPFALRLKKGAIIMLLRNLNPQEGLCNGTRLVLLDMQNHVLKAKVLTGRAEGKEVFIPRIDNRPVQGELPIEFNRRQYPIRLAFSMTINKAQGQTLEKVGILLNKPVFSHGQLYVALSRARSFDNIKIQLPPNHNRKTKNVVYRDIFLK